MKWIRPENAPKCSYSWICSACKNKVHFVSGVNGKRMKDKKAECGYKFCPWCGEKVEEENG